MTNKALEVFLKEQEVGFIRTDVGDKFVLEELKRKNWILGGEPSGHIICLDSTTTVCYSCSTFSSRLTKRL